MAKQVIEQHFTHDATTRIFETGERGTVQPNSLNISNIFTQQSCCLPPLIAG